MLRFINTNWCCQKASEQLRKRSSRLLQRRSAVSLPKSSNPLPEIHCDSAAGNFESLFQTYHKDGSPVVLRQYARDYPALDKWKDLNYLLSAVGPDVPCDIEIGAYNRGEKLHVSFEAYIAYLELWQEHYASEPEENIPEEQMLYLAQNDMTMFGGLKNDFTVPSFVHDTRFGEGRLYQTMIWMGPRGCRSPLHFDPLDNIFVQLVGKKHVSLLPNDIDPEDVYAGEAHNQQSNTSAVDVEAPNLTEFPRYEALIPKIATAVLEPGDALFIPSRCWHHVQSLDFSISVNTWWR